MNSVRPNNGDGGGDSSTSTHPAEAQQNGLAVSATQSNKEDLQYVDEVVSILKTAYPLLALTLETMVDQFSTKFKATPEEEIYRFTFMLLQDGVQVGQPTNLFNSLLSSV